MQTCSLQAQVVSSRFALDTYNGVMMLLYTAVITWWPAALAGRRLTLPRSQRNDEMDGCLSCCPPSFRLCGSYLAPWGGHFVRKCNAAKPRVSEWHLCASLGAMFRGDRMTPEASQEPGKVQSPARASPALTCFCDSQLPLSVKSF